MASVNVLVPMLAIKSNTLVVSHVVGHASHGHNNNNEDAIILVVVVVAIADVVVAAYAIRSHRTACCGHHGPIP